VRFLFHHFSRLENLASRWLATLRVSPVYIPAVGVMALGATVSMSIPVTTLLIIAVLVDTRRWRWSWLAASVGSATGGVVLVVGFYQLGWAQIYALFPDFAASPTWQRVTQWVLDYGVVALAWIAALPLPQTPALVLCGVSKLSLTGVFFAMLLGKLVKYGVVAWMAVHFPKKFAALRNPPAA
jgi:membrane protein YqaA with SNARE-associated domain